MHISVAGKCKNSLQRPTMLSFLNEKNRKLVAIGNTRSQADDCICFCVAYAYIHRLFAAPPVIVNDDGCFICLRFVILHRQKGVEKQKKLFEITVYKPAQTQCLSCQLKISK